ncbi:1427_t:CDS:10 [Ambispora leptoticha]|uniref:1427_t:CDS:1 n=1 Tax=Ambispora leptoticha TaxID=144679 RepID=A0A9N8WEQ6_9GLOM|nr:1427_t:CDS:10 [Ambispora leptoticha]
MQSTAQQESVQGLRRQQQQKNNETKAELQIDGAEHYLFKGVIGGNYMSPIKANNMKKCLEVGFGCGIWMMEMASEFPECQFYGIDLNPKTPENTYPDNCNFLKGDFTDGLPYPDETFDLVHVKSLLMYKPVEHVHKLLKEIYRVTKKGGYFEYKEPLRIKNAGPILNMVQEGWDIFLKEQKIDKDLVLSLDRVLLQQGWKDAALTTHLISVGESEDSASNMFYESWKKFSETFSDIFTTLIEFPRKEEFKKLARNDLEPECKKFKTGVEIAVGFATKRPISTN